MSSQPDMIWQYVQFLKRYFIREGMDKPIIYVDCKVVVNGRKHIQFIDPNVNLAEAEYHPFLSSKWILPY